MSDATVLLIIASIDFGEEVPLADELSEKLKGAVALAIGDTIDFEQFPNGRFQIGIGQEMTPDEFVDELKQHNQQEDDDD